MENTSTIKLKIMDAETNTAILKDRRSTYLLLFVRPGVAACEQAVAKFAMAPFPKSYRKLVVHLSDHCDLCTRFGIQHTPSVAVINNGSLLAVAEDCEPDSCQWLVEFAQQQLLEMKNQ